MRTLRFLRRRARLLVALAVTLGAPVAPVALAEPPPAVLDALFPAGRVTQALASLVASGTLPEDENFQVRELARDAGSSHHVVWIRDREVPHRHDRHDLLVVMLRGHGAMRLGGDARAVGEGSILYVPRGTPHAFANASGEPAVAYAVYWPPFDPADRIPVASPSP